MKLIRHFSLLAFFITLSLPFAWSSPAPRGEYFVYFGTYTGFTYMKEGLPAGESHSKGIYVSRFQPATGALSKPELAAELINPAFLAVHPNRQTPSPEHIADGRDEYLLPVHRQDRPLRLNGKFR
jgi:6-phosphogluconolactonase